MVQLNEFTGGLNIQFWVQTSAWCLKKKHSYFGSCKNSLTHIYIYQRKITTHLYKFPSFYDIYLNINHMGSFILWEHSFYRLLIRRWTFMTHWHINFHPLLYNLCEIAPHWYIWLAKKVTSGRTSVYTFMKEETPVYVFHCYAKKLIYYVIIE